MKKLKSKYLLTLMLLFYSFLSFGQFNMLTHISIKKEEDYLKKEVLNKVENVPSENEKKDTKIRKFFNSTTKADLKRKIASLKNLMLKLSLSKNEIRKLDFKKIEDSLIQMMKEKIGNSNEITSKKLLKTFDFVEEPMAIFSKIGMPLKNKITITSSYGTRTHPIFGTKKMHNGVDLKASFENVYAVMDGVVTSAGWDSKGGGNYIKVKHFNRFETSYLHLSELYYRTGEKVKAGFIIAKSGDSGNSTGPHLHFSVKEFGESINPSHFLNDLIKVKNLIANHYEY